MNTALYVVFISLAWLVAWSVTQGIFMSEFLTRFGSDINRVYLLATIYILTVSIASIVVFKSLSKKVLPKSKLLFLYLIPLLLLVAVPFRYSLGLRVEVYIPMILITCFWQGFLTFGIFQSFLSKKVRQLYVYLLTAAVFTFGHLIFFLSEISFANIYQWLFIFLTGLIFAYITGRSRNIYIANVLHISFYFIFV